MPKEIQKTRHFGKLLKKAIRKEEHNVSKIARLLEISRPTLYTRLEDGDFKSHQLILLHEKKYIELTKPELKLLE